MKLDQVKGIISSSFFSWDLYSGSHEVFKRGLHCSLFEVVVEKSKSAENLTLLFQKLEEQGLVFVNSVNDSGFLFLLSSNQMSNSSERRSGWKKSCGQALFIYRHSRDVSQFSSKPPADGTSLLPVPQDPVMPHLDSFIPAFHYALSKVRSNPPSNLGSGVEQQAHDYLSSLREGKLVHRVRLDYDHKLDEREKLFPAPRQKYNWENYVRSYFFSPHLFTMPVEKAKNMVETLRYIPPESSSDMEAKGGIEPHQDPEKLKQLLKLIQLSKDQKVAKKKESDSEEGASESHGLKRKIEDEENELSPKCQKTSSLNNGKPGESKAVELQSCQSLADVLSSVGLHDTDLRKDKTEGALKVVKLLDKLTETTHDTDLRKDKAQGALVMKMLENLSKTLAGSALASAEGTNRVESTEDTEATLRDSMTKLGLPTNCDIDLRKRAADDGETQGKNDLEKTPGRVRAKREQVEAKEEETAGSLSSLEAFSPCSDTNGQQRGVNLLGEKSIPWVLIPITGLKTERYTRRRDDNLDDPRYLQSPTISTHTSPEKKDVSCSDQPDSSNVLTEPEAEAEMDMEMEVVEDQDTNLTDELKVSHSQEQRGTSHNAVDSIVDDQISGFSNEVEDLLREERVYYIPYSSSHAHRDPPRTPVPPFSDPAQAKQEQGGLPRLDVCKEVHQPALQDMQRANKGQRQAEQSSVRGESAVNARPAIGSLAVDPAPADISSLLSQLQPEVISNLVKIIEGVQKNTVHFYTHSAEEESDVCWEIKEYLKRLGNSECDPQTFIEKKDNQDKLLIIIQNIDIAAHVHKIPALVSLKKLPSVSFAGVDTLDDIKNHTYNELFVSGGFIVSDEFVLNPDFIKQERLETLLQYLEELNTPESPWRWRVHCKTHKKVKEQSRCNSEALSILNLLAMYHKKQIVEFLSYHECDGQSRQAPDLDCLVKLQAQNIRQRHVIFLTERRFEMFPHYSSSGIVIANIDDILYSMASLIGEACDKIPSANLQSCPASPTLREEDMSLCSETDSTSTKLSNLTGGCTSFALDAESGLLSEPYSCAPDHAAVSKANEAAAAAVAASVPSPVTEAPQELDFEALKAAISLFRESKIQEHSSHGQLSQGTFSVNPHQSFLSQSEEVPSGSNSGTTITMEESLTEKLMTHQSSSSEAANMAQIGTEAKDEAEAKACSGTSAGLNDSEGNASTSTFSFSSNVQLACSQTSNRDQAIATTTTSSSSTTTASISKPQISPNLTSETPTDSTQENTVIKSTTEVSTSSSSITQSIKDTSIIATMANAKHNTNAGLLPVPGRMAAFSVNNALVGMDRMLLQSSSSTLWPQGSVGLNSPALSSQNAAIGLRSVTNSLSMVTHSGVRGLMPNNNVHMAWNSLAQGAAAASSVWGVQHSMVLGQVPRTQFLQNYAWQGNPAYQGNRYPPRRGGFGGW
uniref:Transcription activation suppressor a n=1 Tax=Astyanax mexicanus TaxID=7994 RepID=A0A8B9JPC5_ASTMX